MKKKVDLKRDVGSNEGAEPHASPIQVGISACLLGESVRFDGGHKRSVFCSDVLSEYFQFVPLCPEIGIGLGVPRQTIRLVGDPVNPHARGSRDATLDVTDALRTYAERQFDRVAPMSGYIFCANSPSCGMERVRVYNEAGTGAAREGVGIYAKALMTRFPLLPVEESGRLNDPLLRENFVTRVFAYDDWQRLSQQPLTLAAITTFHSRYKLLLMAHSQGAYRTLGQLLGQGHGRPVEELADTYIRELMGALKRRPSRRNHTNVLQHMQGYYSRKLSRAERAQLTQVIDEYRRGLLPLLAPLTLLRHFQGIHPDGYIAAQAYLHPYPEQLKLRYGV